MKNLWLFDKNRLLILKDLLKCSDDVCGCDLKESLSIPKNLLSYHIKILREKGYLIEKKCGRTKQYYVSPEKRDHVIKCLEAVGVIEHRS